MSARRAFKTLILAILSVGFLVALAIGSNSTGPSHVVRVGAVSVPPSSDDLTWGP